MEVTRKCTLFRLEGLDLNDCLGAKAEALAGSPDVEAPLMPHQCHQDPHSPRSGLLMLPEDVLAVILGHLCHLPSLMAVRLVCRLLRKVSYSVITSLNIDDNTFIAGRERPAIAQQLAALPCLTKLCLYDKVLERADVLALPRVASLLRELHVRPMNYASEAAQAFCDAVKSATGITCVTWTKGSGGEALLPPLLASCPRLALLDVSTSKALPAAFPDAVLRLSNLDTLRLHQRQRQAWEDLLPSLTALPRLRDLGTVPVLKPAAATGLARLTRLTRLEVFSAGSTGVLAFTRLSALQSLWVQGPAGWQGDEVTQVDFTWLPRGLPQLTELALSGEFYFKGFGQLTGSLPRLAGLELRDARCGVATLLAAPLQGLRHLSVSLIEGRRGELGALCAALTGLESLSLDVWRVAETDGLERLTRLTSLRIYATGMERHRGPASFLTALTGLEELALVDVLSEHNAQADIQCLARLTRLRRLELKSRNLGWDGGSFERIPPFPPIIGGSQLQPLRALRQLEAWELNLAWRAHMDQVLKELCCYYQPRGRTWTRWARSCCVVANHRGQAYSARQYDLTSKRWRSRRVLG